MELEKLLKIGIEYLSDYFGAFFSTIRSPRVHFPPKVLTEDTIVIRTHDSQVAMRLDPKLLSFLVISIFIGSVLNTNIPGRNEAPDFVRTTVMIIGYWFLFSSFAHVICKTFRGRGVFTQTLSANLQVLAVIHVLSSFITFLWGVVIKGFSLGKVTTHLQGHITTALIESPIYAYFIVQFILVLVYLPLANMRVHGFSSWRLNRVTSNRVFSVVLARAETTLFYIFFLILSLTIAGLSKTNYQVHNVPLSQPTISTDLLGSTDEKSRTKQNRNDTDDLIVIAEVFKNGSASLVDVVPDPRDNTVTLWDVSAARQVRTLASSERGFDGANKVFFSPDGKTLASVEPQGIRLWDVTSGRELKLN